MDNAAIIGTLGTVIVALLGFIRHLYRKSEKEAGVREERAIKREERFMEVLQQNNILHEKVLTVVSHMEKLLTNWRGH